MAYAAPVGPTDPGAIVGFECDWALANGGILVTGSGLAESEVAITSYPDDAPDSLGGWAGFFIEECAGRVPFIVQGYPDGFYRPRAVLGRDAMAVFMRRAMKIDQIAYGDVAEEDQLGDVGEDHWACADIYALVDAEVVLGYPDGLYHPEFSISRAQMAVFVARAADYTLQRDEDGESTLEYDPFPDVAFDFWAAPEIWACARNGVVLGYTDGLYRPTTTVSRDQMAVYSYRAFMQSVANAVVLAGPETSADDPSLASHDGLCGTALDPSFAYVGFDAMRLGTDLAYGGTWDIQFQYLFEEGPTVAETVMVYVDPSEITAAKAAAAAGGSPYFYVVTPIELVTTGVHTVVVSVEDTDGTMYELGRRATFDRLEPPPSPGTARPPNGIGDATWNALTADTRAGSTQLSGSFGDMKVSDDHYYVMHGAHMPQEAMDWSDCCAYTGATLIWSDVEIPAGATEMKVMLEYHVYDPADGTGQNHMPCGDLWCSVDWINMCDEWGSPWVDGVNPCWGWGLVMVNYADAWDWDGSGTGSPSAEIQDTPAEGAFGGAFAYHPQTDMVMTWSIADWTNFVSSGNEVAIHFCGGTWPYLYIDQLMLEFNPH